MGRLAARRGFRHAVCFDGRGGGKQGLQFVAIHVAWSGSEIEIDINDAVAITKVKCDWV